MAASAAHPEAPPADSTGAPSLERAARPRAVWLIAAGLLGLLAIQSSNVRFGFSVPLGGFAALLVSAGLLAAFGAFGAERSHAEISGRAVLRRVLVWTLAAALWCGAVRLAVAGVSPWPRAVGGAAVTVTTALLLHASASFGQVLGLLRGEARITERAGFWLMLTGVVLYVPWLGNFGLLDPWETHYGEVAREMLARDDWLSPWWAQDGWFWSKPVLSFWLQALSFSLFGVNAAPDGMLLGIASGAEPAPEWAARLPVALLTLGAGYVFYRAVARAWGPVRGFCAGLVLLSSPYFALLAHQSMTDMPYVAPLTAAIAWFALGLSHEGAEEVESVTWRFGSLRLRFSAQTVLLGVVVAVAVPQLTYLASRHVTWDVAGSFAVRFHWDEFFAGSGGGNCRLPGNEACRGALPQNPVMQPVVTALALGAALVYFVSLNRGELRTKRLCYQAAWFATALAALAKGAPGLVIPAVVAVATIVVLKRFDELLELELPALALLFAAVCLPWYAQMYQRHGEPFTDRLLFHDMYKRAFLHVHDTNAGDDVSFRYYVWQLGYGLFPWTGLTAAALVAAARPSAFRDRKERELAVVLLLWLLIAFGVFSVSLTKFHHYALPCLPPLAAFTGWLLANWMGASAWREPRTKLGAAAIGAAAIAGCYGLLRLAPGSVTGKLASSGELVAASPALGAVSLAIGVALGALGVRCLRDRPPGDEAAPDAVHMVAPLAILAGIVGLLVTRDLCTTYEGSVSASARLLHLVTYNYKRSWPTTLDFEAVQLAFGVAVALAVFGCGLARFRRFAAMLAASLGFWFAAYSLDVYLPAVAPHYGQREVIREYYRQRRSDDDPLVAYQMNWKGENFYTGNRLPAFVATGTKFKTWLANERERGTDVVYFVTEHARIGALKAELGSVTSLRTLTSRGLNNKFVLVRVEL